MRDLPIVCPYRKRPSRLLMQTVMCLPNPRQETGKTAAFLISIFQLLTEDKHFKGQKAPDYLPYKRTGRTD